MLVFTRANKGSLFKYEEGQWFNLFEVRDIILQGDEVLVLEEDSGQDITHEVLMQIISTDYQDAETSGHRNRILEQFIRVAVHSFGSPTHRPGDSVFSIDVLVRWLRFMLMYPGLWIGDFSRVQLGTDYACLIGGLVANRWKNRETELSIAIHWVGQGSKKAKLERIHNLTLKGWVTKARDSKDKRKTVFLPTQQLVELTRIHLHRSLLRSLETFESSYPFNDFPSTLVEELSSRSDETLDQSHYLPWLTCILKSSRIAQAHFGSRCLGLECWELFGHVCAADWNDEALDYGTWNLNSSIESARKEQRMLRKVKDMGLISEKQNPNDRSIRTITPTPKLLGIVRSFAAQTLQEFGECIEAIRSRSSKAVPH